MTAFFPFEELTWPEVAQLPRTIPLILPLGGQLSPEAIATELGEPAQIGLLPPLPYGWIGSGLSLPMPIFSKFIHNLVKSLRDDGFTHVYIAGPQGIEIELENCYLSIPGKQNVFSPSNTPSGDNLDKVILLPVGHTEQHGFHLPLNTDTLIINTICQEMVDKEPEYCTLLPVLPYGVSTHRSAFAATMNCGGRAFEDFWLAALDNLVTRGFHRFYLLSGHGGNCSFLTNVVKYAGERYPWIFCATSWLYLSGPDGLSALQNIRESKLGGMGHAGELETSLILHLKPQLVHMDRVVDEINFITTPSYYMDWVEGGCLIANPPWQDDSATGSYGAGSLGTAMKGEAWLNAAVEEKIAHVHEIITQHERRIARRQLGQVSWK